MAALSPMKKDGEVNTDELYMVYAGTEPTADFFSKTRKSDSPNLEVGYSFQQQGPNNSCMEM